MSLATGVAPGEHGILGFTVNVPGTDRVLVHILWRDDPDPGDLAAGADRLRTRDRRSPARSCCPTQFRGSGLTEAAYRGAPFVGVDNDTDVVDAMLASLRAGPGLRVRLLRAASTPRRTCTASRRRNGREAAAWTGEQLERLVAGLPDDAALLVTADHGGLDVPSTSRLDIADDVRLGAGLRVVAGEPRFRYLHVEPGAAADVQAAWTEVLGARAERLHPRAGGGRRAVRPGGARSTCNASAMS